MKKFTILFLIILLAITPFNIIYADDYDEEDIQDGDLKLIETVSSVNSEININSRAAVIYERNSGMTLYKKNADTPRPMASTTKIMTAIVVLENSDLSQVVTISKKAAGTGGSRVGLKTGDKIAIHDLLFGLMLKSGNDAAVALAETVGGSVEEFSNMMNNKVLELGLKNTHFVTPHGLDSYEHFTTAKELALLTDYALKIPKFKEIVGTQSYILTINGQSRTINNTNELLGYLSGVYGVKTGFTNGAGRCLVTSTKRGDMDIICVVLGADTKKYRSQDSMKLIEYAFKNFQLVDLNDKFQETFDKFNAENKISIIKGKQKHLELELSDSPALICIRKMDIDSIEFNISIANTVFAPIIKKQIIGTISAIIDDNIIISKNIYVKHEVQAKDIWDYIIEMFKDFTIYFTSTFI